MKHPVRQAGSLVLVCLFSACATAPDGSLKLDERVGGSLKGALGGAVAGCVAGGLVGGDCAKGAVVGAVVGFLIAWHFESKKLANANVVNAKYAKQQKIPKDTVKPASFSSNLKQQKADDGSKEVEITSNTDLVGHGDKAPEVKQRYAIYDEKNKLVEERTETVDAVDGAGSYQTTSTFKPPESAKGKKYRVETELVVDDKPYKKKSYTISWNPAGGVWLAALD